VSVQFTSGIEGDSRHPFSARRQGDSRHPFSAWRQASRNDAVRQGDSRHPSSAWRQASRTDAVRGSSPLSAEGYRASKSWVGRGGSPRPVARSIFFSVEYLTLAG
jgi:hypothetical protein